MRDAWAYSTGSSTTCSKDGRRITLRSRSALVAIRAAKRTTLVASAPPRSSGLADAGPVLGSGRGVMPRTASGSPETGRCRCDARMRRCADGPSHTDRPAAQRPRRVESRVDLDQPCGVACTKAVPRRSSISSMRLARREAMGDLDDLPLGVAEDQQVGLARRAARSAAPFPTSSRSARCAAGYASMPPITIGHVPVGLARALRIDDHAAVGSRAAVAVRRVGIVAADPAVRGVAIDHRIHVAGGDAEEQVRPAERAKARAECQSGCAMMPTRKPCASSTRPTIAMPKLG